MNDGTAPPDDAIARLRAADPASGVEASSGLVERIVADTSAEVANGVVTNVADLATERTKRRPRWLPLVAVAAAMLVIGGAGGYAIAGVGPSAADAHRSPAPLPSESTGADEPIPPLSAGGQTFDVPPGSSTTDSATFLGLGRVHFTSSALSAQASTGAAYAFDPGAVDISAAAANLAQALGVEGEPSLHDGSWRVESGDGMGPALGVNLDGALSFWYSDPAQSPWDCPAEDMDCAPSGDLPSEQSAIDTLRSIMSVAGQDTSTFAYEALTWEGSTSRIVVARLLVDGQRSGSEWSLQMGPGDVFSVRGFLAPVTKLGDYPVVSAEEAFQRLSDPRFGAQYAGDFSLDVASWAPPTAPPATPRSGAALPWPVAEVSIVDATLGLAAQPQSDGAMLIVPAYEFTDSEGGTWSVIAVADEALDFTAK